VGEYAHPTYFPRRHPPTCPRGRSPHVRGPGRGAGTAPRTRHPVGMPHAAAALPSGGGRLSSRAAKGTGRQKGHSTKWVVEPPFPPSGDAVGPQGTLRRIVRMLRRIVGKRFPIVPTRFLIVGKLRRIVPMRFPIVGKLRRIVGKRFRIVPMRFPIVGKLRPSVGTEHPVAVIWTTTAAGTRLRAENAGRRTKWREGRGWGGAGGPRVGGLRGGPLFFAWTVKRCRSAADSGGVTSAATARVA
jgi:hypothetical protein